MLCSKIKQQACQSAPVCGVLQDIRAYLDERVDNSYVRTGVEHFVEVGLPVDEFQLVELLIVLEEKITLADSLKGRGRLNRLKITHLMSSVCKLFFEAYTLDTAVLCCCFKTLILIILSVLLV